MKHKLKAYMAFSIEGTKEEEAILVFAQNIGVAKRMSWQSGELFNVAGWLDLKVTWIKNEEIFLLGDREKLKKDIPHIISAPESCEYCLLWGCGIDDPILGSCGCCGEFVGNKLAKVHGCSNPPKSVLLIGKRKPTLEEVEYGKTLEKLTKSAS